MFRVLSRNRYGTGIQGRNRNIPHGGLGTGTPVQTRTRNILRTHKEQAGRYSYRMMVIRYVWAGKIRKGKSRFLG